ncbi:TolC family protein, partial [Singulisphaera rosea]
MANLVKDGLAMRLTRIKNRLAQVAVVAAAWTASSGCQRLPYIDQSKAVPHETSGTIPDEDKEVTQAQFLSSSLPMPLPKVAKPRTTNDPEAQEIWSLSLQDAIKVGLDNSEVVRVISLGAQGIPIGGFEPTPLNIGTGGGIASSLGSSPLQTVYDPAIQETQIATALSAFDTNFTTSMLWGHNVQPLNNGISAGVAGLGNKYPVIFAQDTGTFQTGLQKRTATGATIGVTHNINYLFSNSTNNVTPSAYTTNTQLTITQPLLGNAPLAGAVASNTGAVGLEANRAPI